MKKLFFIFAVVGLLIGCSNENKFKISGTILEFGNPDEPTMLYLKTRVGNEEMVNLDSVLVSKNGSFVLKGKTSETDLFFLADIDNVFFLRIFVDPGAHVKVSGNAYDITNISIGGSKTQDIYNKYLSSVLPFQEQQMLIEQNFYTYLQDPSLGEEQLEQIQAELIGLYEQAEASIAETTLAFIKENPNCMVASYLVFRNTSNAATSAEIEEQLQSLNPEMDNKFVKSVKKHLEKVKQKEVGATFPNIALPNADGNIISLESLRGKHVLVDFWASWCKPCIVEVPNLKSAYQKYKDKGFEIYSISLDGSREAWLAGIAKHELNWLNVSDLLAFDSPVVKQLVVTYVPHTFLLDPNGVVIAVDLREDALEKLLSQVLK